jgi:integrase
MWGKMWGKMAGKSKNTHPNKALTAIRVRALSEPGRYPDGNGLFLHVRSGGSKQWILRTVVHGVRRDIGLGGLSVVSLAVAREEAARLRKIARDGGDPLAERRRENRAVPTFEEAARNVHASLSPSFKNAKHAKQWINTLEAFVFPVFGSHRVDSIDTPEVLKALEPIWLNTPETARRVRQRIRSVFDWAKASGYRPGDNPVDGLKRVLPKQPTTQKHHTALPYKKVPEFLQALHESGSGVSVKLAFEFLILAATRTSEVLQARWDEIDTDAGTWTIPTERMKANREHRVPLSARCMEILDEARAIADGGSFVFPGQSSDRPLSNMCFHMALRRMDRTDCTPHGFRSSFMDWAAERTNVPREVCEAALAHTLRDKTEAAYNRTDLFEQRRGLMDSWAAFATQETGEVLRMRG